MSDAQNWSLIVGTLMPPLVAVIQQPKWSSAARSVVTVLLCTIAGLITVAVTHGLHVDTHVGSSMLLVAVSAIATYQGFWKPTGIAPVIEGKTAVADHH